MINISQFNPCNGWSNAPTYHYSLDVFNNEVSNDYWNTRARQCRKYEDGINKLETELREYCLDESADITDLSALMHDVIELINFRELAEALFLTCEEGPSSIN